jgi:hypothetical protein
VGVTKAARLSLAGRGVVNRGMRKGMRDEGKVRGAKEERLGLKPAESRDQVLPMS